MEQTKIPLAYVVQGVCPKLWVLTPAGTLLSRPLSWYLTTTKKKDILKIKQQNRNQKSLLPQQRKLLFNRKFI